MSLFSPHKEVCSYGTVKLYKHKSFSETMPSAELALCTNDLIRLSPCPCLLHISIAAKLLTALKWYVLHLKSLESDFGGSLDRRDTPDKKSTQWLFYLHGGCQRRAGCTIVWAVQRVFREQVVLCIHGDRCGEYGHQVLRWYMMTEPTNGSNCTPSGIILHPSPAKRGGSEMLFLCVCDEDFYTDKTTVLATVFTCIVHVVTPIGNTRSNQHTFQMIL